MNEPRKLLTIAGSDSGGAAGLQADLRTWALLGMYGMSALTAVTAQNSHSVNAVYFLPPDFIAAQLDAVLSDYGTHAAKTGFLGRVETIEGAAHKLNAYKVPYLVVDPVLVNHKGMGMFPPAVTQAYIQHLLPLADIITPNRFEAGLFVDNSVESVDDAETAVRAIQALGPQHVLLKHIPQDDHIIDIFFDGKQSIHLPGTQLQTENTHGAGDTLSAALCAFLAQGDSPETAVSKAHIFTRTAIYNTIHWRLGAGHGPVFPTANTS